MRKSLIILRAVGKGVLNAVTAGIAGTALEIADDVWDELKKKQREKEHAEELAAIAKATAEEMAHEIRAVVREVAGDRPSDQQAQVEGYLRGVQAQVRHAFRRPADPTGRTMPGQTRIAASSDLARFLPPRLPRFQHGDPTPPGVDYELLELVGIGGFGEVWKARHAFNGDVVALKFCTDPETAASLRTEARILARVESEGRHAGIVQLKHTYLTAEPPCLAYELVEGGDLTSFVASSARRLSPDQVAKIVRRIASTVGHCHRLDPPIVHRDLKPANILVEGTGSKVNFKVADFGIGAVAARQEVTRYTRRNGSRSHSLTQASSGSYTPLYASPQQMRGEPAEPQDDVYSLGVIWYQLLIGDFTADAPRGRAWERTLRSRDVPQKHIDRIADCIESIPTDRPADGVGLAESIDSSRSSVRPRPEPPPNRPHHDGSRGSDEKTPEPIAAPNPPLDPQPNLGPTKVSDQSRPVPNLLSVDVAEKVEFTGTRAGQAWSENSLKMAFRWCPAGEFLMGSPKDEPDRDDDELQHRVRLTKGFWLGQYEVTQAEYKSVMGTNPSSFSWSGDRRWRVAFQGTSRFPVERVSWEDATAFCRKLTHRDRRAGNLPVGWEYRLPTEAQWEYACRAGTTTATAFGSSLSSRQANFDGDRPYNGASMGPFLQRPTRVGSYGPNDWGLHDLHGNVYEWCRDWYGSGYYADSPGSDPQGPSTASSRVFRGGCWCTGGWSCRAALRRGNAPSVRSSGLGFRVVAVLSGG